MFYSEGIDFDIPETLHLVAPGDHDFAPHWGRLGQHTEISNGFGCLVFFVRWKRSPCSSCEFPSSVISHRIFLQSLGECHRAGIAVKVVMLELSLATWMRKIGPKMCTGLHPRDPDGFLCERLSACLPCWCGSGGWQPNKGCWRGLLLKSVAKPRFLDIPSTVMTGYGWGDDSFDFLQGKRWMDAFWFRVDLKIMISKVWDTVIWGCNTPSFSNDSKPTAAAVGFQAIGNSEELHHSFQPAEQVGWGSSGWPVDQLTIVTAQKVHHAATSSRPGSSSGAEKANRTTPNNDFKNCQKLQQIWSLAHFDTVCGVRDAATNATEKSICLLPSIYRWRHGGVGKRRLRAIIVAVFGSSKVGSRPGTPFDGDSRCLTLFF